jgi:hypothetical protein
MSLYQEPLGHRARPTVIPALMSIPASASMHQHENQATAALAWLADRSLPFARRLAALFIGDDGLVDRCAAIGARAHTLSLPRPGGGAVFPDMSLDGTNAEFQILVEVKVGSESAFTQRPTARASHNRTSTANFGPCCRRTARLECAQSGH